MTLGRYAGRGEWRNKLYWQYAEEYRLMPSLTLAKLIHKEHPTITVEQARCAVRHRRGAHGGRDREVIRKHHCYCTASDRLRASGLAEPQTYNYTPVNLAALNVERWLIMADLHHPFHEPTAIETALKFGKQNGVRGVLLLGDIMDNYQTSKFRKRPDEGQIDRELYTTGETLDTINETLHPQVVLWKEGNHEERLPALLADILPALWPVTKEKLSIPNLLDFSERGVRWVEDKRVIQAGALNILHGHEYTRMGASVSPARTLFLKTRDVAMCAHCHQSSEHNAPTVRGRLLAAWSIGCLCNLHPRYMPLNDWNLGFAILTLTGGDGFLVQNKRILPNGEVV